MTWAAPFGIFLGQQKTLYKDKLFSADQSCTPCCYSVLTAFRKTCCVCIHPLCWIQSIPKKQISFPCFYNSRPLLSCYIFLSLISFCLNYQDAVVTPSPPMSHVCPLGQKWDLNIFPLNLKKYAHILIQEPGRNLEEKCVSSVHTWRNETYLPLNSWGCCWNDTRYLGHLGCTYGTCLEMTW